ncbi:LOG family protein [Priestia aryabhattai]|uniref:LOG family protein n=1 Tax=Priestia aryabhattai TaxID=412384 RepID=UPI001ADA6B3B|nr:LOG family protein [Priestia aryabhattai]QTL47332.1 LOG family protein [Priestia aryabhattai]
MDKIELHGTIFYEPTTNKWGGSGTGWWIEKTAQNTAKITFEERVKFNPLDPLNTKSYSLSISNINKNGNLETHNVDEEGFIIAWKDYSDSTCMASFTVAGTKVEFVPNERALNNEESIADIHAAGLLFDYEAKYGVVTVMGSASISSKKIVDEKLNILNGREVDYKLAIESEENTFNKQLLEDKLEKTYIKMERQKKIEERGTKYWHSAKKFGELWGQYAAQEQKRALGGCYVPICTGGGPGIMQAVAEGARNQDAHVVGIDCQFGNDDFFNLKGSYSVASNQRLRMNNFSIREGVLINYSHVVLFWPGGFGTTWEVCETLSKISTRHLRRHRTKAIFVHQEYWEPFFKFLDHIRSHGAINSYGDRIKIPGVDDQDPDDAYIAEVVDTAEEAFTKTRTFVEDLYKRNQLTLRGN